MLSASDAGRIGRLVLPKKCAEAYFPPISQPEGLPLKVQDVKGKEWVFQFRFWPNNNSRMLEPEGKLVMGGRKASAIPSSDQGDEVTVIGTDASNPGDGSARHKSGDVISVNGQRKGKSSNSLQPISQDAGVDQESTCSEIDKSGSLAEKILEDKPVIHSKRKNSNFSVKNKRLRIDNEDVIELKLTWREAQGLMRPPAKIVPSFFVVEGCEFEEFEEAAPVIGRPTILGIDHFGYSGSNVRTVLSGVKCLQMLFFLQGGSVQRMYGTLTADEELTKEQLEHLLPAMNKDASRKEDITDQDADLFVALEGLDALANLAIQGEGEGLPISSESRTKHPRHKPGCTCIVCLQPPSGKGSKHSQSCDCVVCSSLKRRFRTLMERREKKQLEKEVDSSSQSLQWQQSPEKPQAVDTHTGTDAGISGLNQEEVESGAILMMLMAENLQHHL
ncbi:UNVERIFIED_CONTAM: B3 domain-containing protein [Sesamum radiatum]|uniref:B3 domain-containing protein n=1 Tax=Sesamum radiatum TaxID=300843 RepID=A0AAW2KFU5_SESRA